MTDPRPTSARSVTLQAAVLAALVSGAVAGAGAFALLRTVAPPDPTPLASVERASGETPVEGPAPDTASVPPLVAAELESLRSALDTAEAERSQLAGTLLALNRRAETLESELTALTVSPPSEGTAGERDDALPSGADGDVIVAGEQGRGIGEDGEATDSLIAAGLDEQSAADIRRRRDEFALARLELFDQAAREGWEADSDRLGEAIEALEESRPDLREELGDEAYDRYLYEEGDDNRIGIASVIPGSAASQAGIVAGDVVLSYAGSRMFRSRELQEATRSGTRGEYVQVSVLRDGQIVAVDVPRGPLGVTLDGVRRPPD